MPENFGQIQVSRLHPPVQSRDKRPTALTQPLEPDWLKITFLALKAGKFLELKLDFANKKLITNHFTEAYTWIFPLLAGNELIGVIKIEDLHVPADEFKNELPTFFNYLALVRKMKYSDTPNLNLPMIR